MSANNVDLMSLEDRNLYNELKKKELAYIKDNSMLVTNSSRAILSSNCPNGLSLIMNIMVKYFQKVSKNPTANDIKTIALIADDNKVNKVETEINASDIFKGIVAIGEVK